MPLKKERLNFRGRGYSVVTAGRAGGMRNREPFKAGDKCSQRKVAFPNVARPGGEATTQAPRNCQTL